jgi:hypothetical protein
MAINTKMMTPRRTYARMHYKPYKKRKTRTRKQIWRGGEKNTEQKKKKQPKLFLRHKHLQPDNLDHLKTTREICRDAKNQRERERGHARASARETRRSTQERRKGIILRRAAHETYIRKSVSDLHQRLRDTYILFDTIEKIRIFPLEIGTIRREARLLLPRNLQCWPVIKFWPDYQPGYYGY